MLCFSCSVAHLFSTFPEPPLTLAESPFSTARKFWGVTSWRGRTNKVKHSVWTGPPSRALWLFKQQHSHPRCSLWGLPCTRRCRWAGWWSGRASGSWAHKHQHDSGSEREMKTADTTPANAGFLISWHLSTSGYSSFFLNEQNISWSTASTRLFTQFHSLNNDEVNEQNNIGSNISATLL